MLDKALLFLFGLMSNIPISIGRFMGKMLGTAFLFIPFKRKKVLINNLREALGSSFTNAELKKLEWRIFSHFGMMFFEVPHILRLNHGNLEKYLFFRNEHNLSSAIKKGKGVFILTGHFGNWELMNAAVSLRFARLSVVARPFDFKPLENIMTIIRSRFGAEIIPKMKGMRKILMAIRQKRMVGILLDQNVDWYDGVFVDYLGKKACTNKGLALLALKTGAPVIPAFSVRQKDGRYCIIFGKEIKLERSKDKIRDVEENTSKFTAAIEEYVRKYPDHWFWFHMRWKTRPYCRLPDNFYAS
ncbi:MAG: lysophospholipid acyltransferase family protein [Deltaproteobacteria bacterium]|nr:lysophospholipid acyltransferase family protein [Deltaproteobacteria bacterium]